MTNNVTGILLKGYLKVFNAILISGHFPESWCEGIITLIFKLNQETLPIPAITEESAYLAVWANYSAQF
jgi:hypothetical protein